MSDVSQILDKINQLGGFEVILKSLPNRNFTVSPPVTNSPFDGSLTVAKSVAAPPGSESHSDGLLTVSKPVAAPPFTFSVVGGFQTVPKFTAAPPATSSPFSTTKTVPTWSSVVALSTAAPPETVFPSEDSKTDPALDVAKSSAAPPVISSSGGFLPVPSRLVAKAAAAPPLKETPTSNQFLPLVGDLMEIAHPATPEPPVPVTPKKPMPILFLGGDTANNICKLIAEAFSEEIRHRPFHKFIKIFPRTTEEEMKILAILADQGVGHFRHSHRKNSFIKTVIKGLPRDTEPRHIAEALSAEGYIITKVVQLTRARTKAPLPIFQILVVRTGNFKAIFQLNSLLGKKVLFENYKKIPRVPQCYSCQHFGHTSHHCQMGPRCRYCGLGHDSRTCPSRLDKQAHHCANCGGPHLSSSAVCPLRPKIKKRDVQGCAARRLHPSKSQFQAEDAATLLDALRTVRDAIADVFGDLANFKKNVAALAATTSKADKMSANFALISP